MGGTGRVRVLHVDDDPDFAEVATAFLERHDDRIEVVTATGASEGLERFRTGDVDCIVSDYGMPGTDGLEFLAAVREVDPDIPFILFTGKGSEEIASEAVSAGVTDYLQKGGDTEQYELLANRIRNAVEGYRAERAAETTERQLAQIAENTTDVLWMFTADWDELLFVNSAYEDIWGQSVAALEADARHFLEGVHPDDRSRVRAAMDRLSGGERVDVEYRVNEAEGYGRWVWVQGAPVLDEAGRVDRVVGFARDVTERKEYEAELELRNRAMDEAPVGITITDASRDDNPIVYVNERFETLTGYSADEAVGRNCRFLQGPGTEPEPVAAMRTAIDAGDPVSVEIRNYRKDGTPFRNLVRIAPVENDAGEVTHFVGFQQDVTERRARTAGERVE